MRYVTLDISKEKELEEISDDIKALNKATESTTIDIKNVEDRAKAIAEVLGVNVELGEAVETIGTFNKWLTDELPYEWNKKINGYELSETDLLASTLIGGIAVVLDFIVVKLPKESKVNLSNDGSPLTEFLRSLGSDENGKVSKWVTWLENKCKVPYDASVSSDIPGFSPKTHRLRSLSHDPLIGLVFAIMDINNGTMTVIDKNGKLIIKEVSERTDNFELLIPAVKWIGHLLSDVTTKMGIQVPGWCLLKELDFGSFGDKNRTISEVAEYMYLTGYDLRHLATMSIVNMVISLLCRLYFKFLGEVKEESATISTREFIEIKNKVKFHRICAIAHSIAVAGNITKLLVMKNPNALNLPLMIGFIKEAITQAKIITRDTKEFEEIIEGRYILDNNWKYLAELTERM